MKAKRKKWASLLLCLALFAAMLPDVWVSAAAKAEGMEYGEGIPAPIFSMDFENLPQEVGASVDGNFQAATGQDIEAHDTVVVTAGRDGQGKALILDNAAGKEGYLSTANTEELNPKDLTASVWIKKTGSVRAKDEGRIFWAKGASWDGAGWFMGWTAGETIALVTDGTNLAGQNGNPEDFFPQDEWIHIAGVFDSATGEMTVYKNGQKVISSQVAGAAITQSSAAEILIGNSGYGNKGLGCAIDDVQIFGQAFSEKQVGMLAGLTDQDFAQMDADSLYIPGRVSEDFTLPLTGANGSAITWRSDNSAIAIGQDGAAHVTRGQEDVAANLTATVTYQGKTAEKVFSIVVVKESQPVEGLQKLSYNEILDVGGAIGTRLKDSMKVYGMDYLYTQKMQAYLDEYKNHSHSGWSWLEGEQPGKWLESMANSRWMDTSGTIKAAITDVVSQLSSYQTIENRNATGYNQFAGYLGNGTEAIRNSKPVKGMDPYEMYSTLNGLIAVYENYHTEDSALSEKALDCAIGLADYLAATIGDENAYVPYQDGTLSNVKKSEFWPLAITNGTTIAGHDVHQGWEGTLLIDPMMRLSKLLKGMEGKASKSLAYSSWADWAIDNIDKWASSWNGHGDTPYADLDNVAAGTEGIDAVQHYVHAHTFQMNFLGFLKKYQETGDEAYLKKVVGAWNDISGRQKYITGTVSVGEHYEAGHNLPNTGSVGETCATNSWTLMNHNLFELTEDAAYEQTVEDIIFNHMFATSTIDGDGYSYHRPLNGTTERFYTGPDCCSSSGMRMQSYVPYYIYSKSDSEVYVNQFIQSEVNIQLENGTSMHLRQVTDYPKEDRIQIEVMEGTTAEALKIRVPDWVKEPSIQINGTAASGVAIGNYVALSVKPGDKVTVTYPSELVWVKGDYSNEGLWAMKKGPMVYCIDAAFMTKEESIQAFGTEVAKVTSSGVLDPEDGKAVKVSGTLEFAEGRYLGTGYKVPMATVNGEQPVTVVPYANIGQWYRYGEEAPGLFGSGYSSAARYSYAIWMSSGISDYPQEPEPESKPVVHYDFDTVDGTVVKDLSGNGHDAAAVGNISVKEGSLGSSIYLNGTDAYVQLPKDILYGLYNMTVSVWVNPDELGSWARIFDFGSLESPPYPNLFLTANAGGNLMRLAYEDGDNSHANAPNGLAIGQWQHVAVTLNGSKAELYVNGKKVAENAGFHFMPSKTADMASNFLGKSNYTADRLFKGYMDDFRIYNRPLDGNEIAALARGEEPAREIQTVVNPETVETLVGKAPVLPATAKVTYTNGTEGKEPIEWESILAEQYAVPGSFRVSGKIGNFAVEVTVVVKEDASQQPPQPIPVQSVRFNKKSYSLEMKKTVTLKAVISPSNADNQAISWKSSNSGIASVNQNGTVTGKKPGTVTITVITEDGKKTDTCRITVKKPLIQLNYTALPLQIKKSTSAVKLKSSSVKGEKIKSAKSSKTKVASVKVKSGKLTVYGRKAGSAVITVTSSNGGTAKVKITVKKKVNVTKLGMSQKKATLNRGKKLKLKVTKTPVTATSSIKWTSSKPSVASVSSKGVVKAKTRGRATITAKSGNGKKATCKITVK